MTDSDGTPKKMPWQIWSWILGLFYLSDVFIVCLVLLDGKFMNQRLHMIQWKTWGETWSVALWWCLGLVVCGLYWGKDFGAWYPGVKFGD